MAETDSNLDESWKAFAAIDADEGDVFTADLATWRQVREDQLCRPSRAGKVEQFQARWRPPGRPARPPSPSWRS